MYARALSGDPADTYAASRFVFISISICHFRSANGAAVATPCRGESASHRSRWSAKTSHIGSSAQSSATNRDAPDHLRLQVQQLWRLARVRKRSQQFLSLDLLL